MVRAWYIDNEKIVDPKLENHRNPPHFLTLDELVKTTGVKYYKLNLDTFETDGILDEIRKANGYNYEDEVVIAKEKCDYEKLSTHFFTEHLHSEDEIRFVIEGSGYFDVRNINDDWVRIEVSPGDMLIEPSGVYHRFTLDSKNYIKARRYFVNLGIPIQHSRPCEEMECRKEFLKKINVGVN